MDESTQPRWAATAHALADELVKRGVPVFARDRGMTKSHQFAIEAARYGGGQAAAKLLRKANILSCGIGLPISPVNDGLRMGTPEIVRWGMTAKDMPRLAQFIEEALERARPAGEVGQEVAEFRGRFSTLHFVRQ